MSAEDASSDQIMLGEDHRKEISEIVSLSKEMGNDVTADQILSRQLRLKRREIEQAKRKKLEREREERGRLAAIEVFGEDELQTCAEAYLTCYRSEFNQVDILETTTECIKMFGILQTIAYRRAASNPEKAPNSAKLFDPDVDLTAFNGPQEQDEDSVLDNTGVRAVAIPVYDDTSEIAHPLNESQQKMLQMMLKTKFGNENMYGKKYDELKTIICFPTPELINTKAKQDCCNFY